MDWYYVDDGKQAGPVDDGQLEALVRSGKVVNDTLVWREGLQDWQKYAEALPSPSLAAGLPPVVQAAGPLPGPGEAICVECGQVHNVQDMISHGGVHVCALCKPVFFQKLVEGAKVPTGVLNYAGFWIRVGAKLIDGLILAVIFLPPLILIALNETAKTNEQAFPVLQLLAQFLYAVANIGYQIFFLGKYGATLGKMACGLRVVSAEGGKIGYGRATGRVFAEMLSGMICYIGYLMVAFDDQKRGLHDHICNTRVIFK